MQFSLEMYNFHSKCSIFTGSVQLSLEVYNFHSKCTIFTGSVQLSPEMYKFHRKYTTFTGNTFYLKMIGKKSEKAVKMWKYAFFFIKQKIIIITSNGIQFF